MDSVPLYCSNEKYSYFSNNITFAVQPLDPELQTLILMRSHAFSRLEQLDSLINLKATGDPKALARKMNISLRAVYDYINVLKSLGAPIKYNRHRNTYYYEEGGRFHFKFIKAEAED